MRIVFALACVMILTLLAGSALGADVTGKWTGEVPDAGFTLMFDLHQDGTALTGTSTGPDGSAIQIKDGKVEGDKVSFVVELPDMGMSILHEATVNGDEMTLTFNMGDGGGGMGPVTLKRVK